MNAYEEGSIPGGLISTSHGEIWVNEVRVDLRSHYGQVYLKDAFCFSEETASLLGLEEVSASLNLRHAAYIDTETTGLRLAISTLPFLIGVGTVEGDNLVVKQLFVHTLDNEPAVLSHLSDLLEGIPLIVTFNGKRYDIPLLMIRYLFNGKTCDLDSRPHLDLLQMVRKLYKRKIGSCSLISCERQVLGFMRENDVPANMIPSIYISFLQEGRTCLMPLLFHHNLQDIVAMLALLGNMAMLPLRP